MASNQAPVVDRIRIIPRPGDFLGRNIGNSGEVFFNKETNSLRVYSGKLQGGYEVVTEPNLRQNIANAEVASIRYAVTINNFGQGNKYILHGVTAPKLTFVQGYTYIFDQSDFTNVYYPNPNLGTNNQHPLNFSANNLNGELEGGTSYLEGVIYKLDDVVVTQEQYSQGFERADKRIVQISITTNTPETLYYWCERHLNMGAEITVAAPGAGTGGASISVSDAQPVEAESGNLWFNSTTGALYVYYTDGDSSQWIQPVVGSSNSSASLTSFAVNTAAPSATSSLAYDNTTGVFTYTPPEPPEPYVLPENISANSLTLSLGSTVNEVSNDSLLADASTSAIPTEFAVKTYVDNAVGSGPIIATLEDLTNVVTDSTTSTDGAILRYDATSGDWNASNYLVMNEVSYSPVEYQATNFAVNPLDSLGLGFGGPTNEAKTGVLVSSVTDTSPTTIFRFEDNYAAIKLIVTLRDTTDAHVQVSEILIASRYSSNLPGALGGLGSVNFVEYGIVTTDRTLGTYTLGSASGPNSGISYTTLRVTLEAANTTNVTVVYTAIEDSV